MRVETVIAIVDPELQNDLVATLHARNAGHLARIVRGERGDVAAQFRRVGIDSERLPATLAQADRALIVTAAHRSAEIGWLLLQRGATSVWIVSPDQEWTVLDDMTIAIAASAELPPRPVPPAHRSGRTFRPSKHRRRSRHVPADTEPKPTPSRSEPSSRS